jgi:membrane protease subunit HflC
MTARITSTAIVLLAAVLLWRCVFIVDESDTAMRMRFGQILGTQYGPGLHFRSPFDEVRTFDRRVLSRMVSGESFLTRDQKALNIDFYLKWRLLDPLRLYQVSGGDADMASLRLTDQVRDRLKGAVATQTFAVVIAEPRATLSVAAFNELQTAAAALGLDLIDVQIHRIDLTDDVASAVYQRMQQELIAKAQQLRSSGAAEAEKIRGDAERQRAEILAEATRQSQHLRGEADSQASAAYARAYGRNAEFSAFYRSMQAYKNTLGRDGDILVVAPEGEFFKYLHSANGR